MSRSVYTPAQAAAEVQVSRAIVDGACASGALRATDARPQSTKRQWRILHDDLLSWVRSGMPTAS